MILIIVHIEIVDKTTYSALLTLCCVAIVHSFCLLFLINQTVMASPDPSRLCSIPTVRPNVPELISDCLVSQQDGRGGGIVTVWLYCRLKGRSLSP